MVKRYNPHSSIDVSAWIVEDAGGSVVLHSDYAAIEAELARVREVGSAYVRQMRALEAALEKACFWIARDTDALEACHKPYDLDNPLDVEVAQEVDDRRTWLTRATTETPDERHGRIVNETADAIASQMKIGAKHE